MKSIFVAFGILLSAPSVWAYAYVPPIKLAIDQAAEDKSKSTQFGITAQQAQQEYQCALNPSAAGCDATPRNAENANIPECGEGKFAAPAQNGGYSCVPMPTLQTQQIGTGDANVASGGEEKPRGEPRTSVEDKDKSKGETGPARARTDDDQVTTAQQNQANQCRSTAATANTRCQQSLRSINGLKSEVASLSETGSNGESAASACKFMQERAASIGSQMQTFRGQCESAVSACETACAAAVDGLAQLRTSAAYVTATNGRSTCATGRSNVSTMNVNIQQAHDASTRGQQCYRQATGGESGGANDTAGNANTPATNSNNANTNTANNNTQAQNNTGSGWQMPDFSGLMNSNTATPTTTTQIADAPQDCNNPQFAASSPVCICRINSADPRCGGAITAAEGLGTAVKDINPNFKTAGDSSPQALRLGAEDKPVNGHQPSKMGRYQGQGRGGGGMPSAGGNTSPGSPSAARGWSYGSPRADSSVGSGGAMGGGRSAGGQAWSPEEGHTGRGGRGTTARPANVQPRAQVDLRRFLPSANGNSERGPANVGAIGLKHTDIFRTVRDRYGRKAESLNP